MGNRRRSTCVIVDIFKTETQDPGTRSNKHFCPRIGTNRNPLFLIRVFPHISRLLEVWGFRINSDASLPGPIVISSLLAFTFGLRDSTPPRTANGEKNDPQADVTLRAPVASPDVQKWSFTPSWSWRLSRNVTDKFRKSGSGPRNSPVSGLICELEMLPPVRILLL